MWKSDQGMPSGFMRGRSLLPLPWCRCAKRGRSITFGNFLTPHPSATINFALDILLLSRDPRLVATTQSACANLGITLRPCSDSWEGRELLTRSKIYAVVYDDTDPRGVAELLGAIRESPSSKNAVSIAVVNGFRGMAHTAMLVLPKAGSAELITRTLRVAHAAMRAEQRRYFRHPLQAPVILTTASVVIPATSIDLSHCGMAFRIANREPVLVRGSAVSARLVLDPLSAAVDLAGKIAWYDGNRTAGLQYECVSSRDQSQIQRWLAGQAGKSI